MKLYFTFIVIMAYSCFNGVKNNEYKVDTRFIGMDSDPISSKEEGGFTYYPIQCDTCNSDIYWYFHLYPNDKLILDFKDFNNLNYDSLEFYFNSKLIYKTQRERLVMKNILLADSLINKNSFNYLKASTIDKNTKDTIVLDLRVFVFFIDGKTKQKSDYYPIW